MPHAGLRACPERRRPNPGCARRCDTRRARRPRPKSPSIAFQVAVAQTNEGQRDFADLQKKYAPKQASAQDSQRRSRQPDQAVADARRNLSEPSAPTAAKTIDDKKKQLDRDVEDARNDFQQEMQDMYNSLASEGLRRDADLRGAAGISRWFWISPSSRRRCSMPTAATNITKPVIDAYNVKSGVPAPPPPASHAAAPKPTDCQGPGVANRQRPGPRNALSIVPLRAESEGPACRGLCTLDDSHRVSCCGKFCGLLPGKPQ